MAKQPRGAPTTAPVLFDSCGSPCWECGGPPGVVYYKKRTLVTLQGIRRLVLQIRRCGNPDCLQYRRF